MTHSQSAADPPSVDGGARGLSPGIALAALRVLLAAAVLLSADVWRAPLTVPAPGAPATAPALFGAPWLWLPRSAGVVHALVAVVVVSAALVLAGAATRASSTVLTLSLTVLLGLVQLQGTPVHVHHLAWMAALVAAGGAGGSFSVDALVRRWRGGDTGLRGARAGRDAGAAIALRAAALVLALVYFFPGLHKLVDAGSPFFDGASLQRLIRLKALEAGGDVPFGLDAHPALLVAGGAVVIGVELSMPLLACLRPWTAGVAALVLHAVFAVGFHMPFGVLAIFAPVFFLDEAARRASAGARHGVADRGGLSAAPRAGLAVAGVVLTGVVVAGALGEMRGYPFACYPTFAVPVPHAVPDLRVFVGAQASALPYGVLAPEDVRTAVVAAARRVRTAGDARRFLAWRMRDPRFAAAVAGARARVVLFDVNLDDMRRYNERTVSVDVP